MSSASPATCSDLAGGKDLVLCDLAAEVLRVSGRLTIRVLGDSMLPVVLPGDVVTVHRAGIADVACGDLVLYSREGGFVVHRVVGRSGEGLLTRGDALRVNDPLVLPSQLLGKIVSIRRLRREFAPAASMNRAQKALGGLLRRYPRLRSLFLHVCSIRMRINRLRNTERNGAPA